MEVDDKLFSNKLLSKQIVSVEPSFRILYYGGASGSVPFTWESQPGTPKHTFSDSSLPPLTPPPSYQSQSRQTSLQLNRSKSSFLRSIFSSRKSSCHVSPSFSWSSSSGSSGYGSTPMNWPLVGGGSGGDGKPHFVRSTSVVRFGVDEEEDEGGSGHVEGSGTPTLCFSKKLQGRGRMNKVKSALMSIVGHTTRA